MKLIVDTHQRHAKMRAHTATHLLHFALDTLLQGTKQAGSLVENDFLRFDFSTKAPLTDQQLHQIESKINHWILHGLEVQTEEMSLNDAQKTGAKAFFEDKYDNRVRVVSIQDSDVALKSIELCGGTHVQNTKDIGAFIILDQESVASGIRRISAVTGPRVAQYAQSLQQEILTASTKLACQPKQFQEKLDKIITEFTVAKEHVQELKEILIRQEIVKAFTGKGEKMHMGPQHITVFLLDITATPLKRISFKEIISQTKSMMHMHSWIIYNQEGNYAVYATADSFSAKDFAQAHQLQGGGTHQLIQGKDEKILDIVKKQT